MYSRSAASDLIRWASLSLAIALGALAVFTPETRASTAPVTFVVGASPGDPLAGATVAVYLDPFDARFSYEAPLVASGVTDAAGRFTFDAAEEPELRDQAPLAEERVANVSVYAADFDRKLVAVYSGSIPVDRGFEETIFAVIPMGAVVSPTELEVPLDNGLASQTSGTQKLAERSKWVRITQHHIGHGFNGRFCYLNGRNTSHQVAIRFRYGGDWGPWEIGSWKMEQRERTAGSCAPSSAAKRKGARGPYHKLRIAKYEEHKVQSDSYLCDPGGGGCVQSFKQEWRPHHWMGALGIARRVKLSQPKPHSEAVRIRRWRDFWKDTKQNTEFGRGVVIVGLELNSRAGYSEITKLWWLSTPRCRINLLYGGAKDPVDAKGPVYSSSRGC